MFPECSSPHIRGSLRLGRLHIGAGDYLITNQSSTAPEGRLLCSEEAGTCYRQERAVEENFGELTPAAHVKEACAGVWVGALSPR